MKPSSGIQLLLRSIEAGFERKAWHGTNLRGSIRGISAREAAWRPAKGRHNIWEVVVHCAYWKYAVRRRILNEKHGSFPLKGSNWFRRPEGKLSEELWKRDVELLSAMHRLMVDAIARLNTSDLRRTPRGSKVDTRSILTGIAMHDVYHAGQIQLIKRLM